MKIILVDAVDCLIIRNGENFEILEPMRKILDEFPNRKIILTGADEEQFKKFGLDRMPYEVFTLKHNPEKTNPEYYIKLLDYFNLKPDNVIYFEHNHEAVLSAQSLGIKTHYWDNETRPLKELGVFLKQNN